MLAQSSGVTTNVVPSEGFVLRTPLLPIEAFLALGKDLSAATASDQDLEAALEHDRQLATERLWDTMSRNDVREALFIASPTAFEACDVAWRVRHADRLASIERTAMRYLTRMCTRPTPYGLFAGCTLGQLGAKTLLQLPPRCQYRRRSRLDAEYLHALFDQCMQDVHLVKQLPLFPNSSLYRAGLRWRYAVATVYSGARQHHLVAVNATRYLDLVLEKAETGATHANLVQMLVECDPDGEITPADAEAYVDELLQAQILVSDLSPCVTGPDSVDPLLLRLSSLDGRANVIGEVLTTVKADLASLDASGLGNPSSRYFRIAERLSVLQTPVDRSRLFQVDLFKPTQTAFLSRQVADQVAQGVDILWRMNSPSEREDLKRFREAFRTRYEHQEVALVDALDEEDGVGFGSAGDVDLSTLIDDIPVPTRVPAVTVELSGFHNLLLAKLSDALRSRSPQIDFTRQDIAALGWRAPVALPNAFHAVATVFHGSAGGSSGVLLRGCGGPSGARLLGRFCHLDEGLERSVRQHLSAEEAMSPNAIFAEIVHLPSGRLANILSRPVLRSYEIPFLGLSGAPVSHQIRVNDLLISLVGDRIVLRSRRLGVEVIPRLTSAHNYSRGLGIYRFLCALQSQHATEGVGWNWGAFSGAPFLPRVVFGAIVLSRARWQLEAAQIRLFRQSTLFERFKQIRAWRRQWDVPRFVSLVDGDNELVIDLDNALSVDTLTALLENRSAAALVEMFPPPDDSSVTDPEGHFTHELLLSFVRNPAPSQVPSLPKAASVSRSGHDDQRHFSPGSEWLYTKVYTSPAMADAVLSDVIRPFASELVARGLARKWFFIRYGDPERHIRFRLLLTNRGNVGDALGALQTVFSTAIKNRLVRRIQIDSYDRETERYGGLEGIELAEELFCADSEAAAALIQDTNGTENAQLRGRVCLKSFDVLLTDFRLEPREKLEFVRRQRDMLASEHLGGKHLKIKLGDKFRQERKALELVLSDMVTPEVLRSSVASHLGRRSEQNERIVAGLVAHHASGRITRSFDELLPVYLHLVANRLLRSSSRTHELVLYDFLSRLYESQLAREKHAAGVSQRSSAETRTRQN